VRRSTHVSWSSTGVLSVFVLEDSSDSKVCDSDVSSIVKYKVFWFDISMDDVVVVQVFKSDEDASNKKF
jgi:hypothetical protein